MAKLLKLYIDTSVISHIFHDDTPERQADTKELFENVIQPGLAEGFISSIVLDELMRTKDEALRSSFLAALEEYSLSLLPKAEPEILRMATLYIQREILPRKCSEDALHLAFATVFGMDVLVTWDFRHLANATTGQRVSRMNKSEGYFKPLLILTPLEILQP